MGEYRVLWASRHPWDAEELWFKERHSNVKFFPYAASVTHGNELIRKFRDQYCDEMAVVARADIFIDLIKGGVHPLRPLGKVYNDAYTLFGFERIEAARLDVQKISHWALSRARRVLWASLLPPSASQMKWVVEMYGKSTQFIYLPRNVLNGAPFNDLIKVASTLKFDAIAMPPRYPLWRIVRLRKAFSSAKLLLANEEKASWHGPDKKSSRGQEIFLRSFSLVTNVEWKTTKLP